LAHVSAQTAPQAPAPAGSGQPPSRPAPAPPAGSGPGPAKPSAATPPAAENFTYQPEGRRDPFQSLLGIGSDSRGVARRSDGPAGLSVADITVRGTLESRGALIAMIQGPDKKTYVVHQGDKLLDGTIKSITPQGLVVVQEVNDPLSVVKQREIRKLLRSLEDAKE